MKIRVFLADDHAVVRDGLRLILEAQEDITVVGEAADGHQAVDQVLKLKPDIVLMDIAMPKLNGIEATQQILKSCPSVKVVILSMHSSSEHISRALRAGALGYLLKESAGKEVVKAVKTVYLGQRYLCQKISESVIDDYIDLQEAAPGRSPLTRLSPREREILQLVAEGKTTKEIAGMLYLSTKTIETYRSRLMVKLGINDVPGLVKFAIQHGITSLE
jgi:DNA-binding NarL/FixJ family response regulator